MVGVGCKRCAMGSLQVEFPLVFLRALMDVPLHSNITLQNAHLEGTGPCNFVAWKTEETVSMLLGGRDESLQLQPTEEGLCCRDCKQKLLILCPLCQMKLMPKHVPSHFAERHESEPDSQEAMLSCLYVRQQHRMLCKFTFKPDPKECPFCGEVFTTSPAVFRRHKNVECTQNPLYVRQCKDCESEPCIHTRGKNSVKAKRRRSSLVFQCPLCNYAMLSAEECSVHILDDHSAEERAHHCELCQRYFINSHALLTHRRIKHSETVVVKVFKCRVCCHSFDTREELNADMEAHAKEGLFICDICNKESTSFDTLRRHIQGVHKSKFPAYCEKCRSGIVNKKAVSLHSNLRNLALCTSHTFHLLLIAITSLCPCPTSELGPRLNALCSLHHLKLGTSQEVNKRHKGMKILH
ncbi:hypothetical protein CAPTEDRAFT_190075 [Capitella teleta]|uniref:C2H2-type domain-containing protein n=1 Tax=Capitella teleta TaxID=283909 RepID=R7TNV0_CAPTE|nr:hypothetical protein CAPTEDRAFT_190075 [Capitella teleta]|eukprot:ELT95294.1 hypothetical protein CAPTEDRAFT_190075 [Capitella teleta]